MNTDGMFSVHQSDIKTFAQDSKSNYWYAILYINGVVSVHQSEVKIFVQDKRSKYWYAIMISTRWS